MDTILLTCILIGVLVLGGVWCLVAFKRNEWVYSQRKLLIRQVGDEVRQMIAEASTDPLKLALLDVNDFMDSRFNEYLSYDEMMSIRYWHVWDIEKLKRVNA